MSAPKSPKARILPPINWLGVTDDSNISITRFFFSSATAAIRAEAAMRMTMYRVTVIRVGISSTNQLFSSPPSSTGAKEVES